MKCQSCNVQIDPKWKHAIEKNVCPFCGESIMDQELQDLLVKAKDLINSLMSEKYKESFTDWIRSNYNFVLSNQKITKNSESVLVETTKPVLSKQEEIFSRIKIPVINKEERISSAMSKLNSSLDDEEEDLDPLSDLEVEEVSNKLASAFGNVNEEDEGIVVDIRPSNKKEAMDALRLQQHFDKAKSSRENIQSGSRGSFKRGG